MACKHPKYALSSGNHLRCRMDTQLRDEVLKFSNKKKQLTMKDTGETQDSFSEDAHGSDLLICMRFFSV